MNTAKGTPRMRPEARRQQLLRVAYACLADQGLAGLSLESVARSANVTSPLLRHYFGSREGLITAVVQAAIDEVMAILDAPLSAGGLEPRLRAYLQLIQRDPWAHGVWMHGGESHPAV
ncbi:MAG TPA: TetR/AcrR family transcriptional regulator, partial [Baekduia sp.]|nr:TetR/AcrR family transcriptional regulator [Baekduia sp.]